MNRWWWAAFLAGGSGVSRPSAPVLTWTSVPSVDPPEFEVIIDITVAEGDTFELQYDDNASFTSPTTVSTTVSAADIGGLEIIIGDDEAPLDPFGNGTWYVRCRVGPPGALSAYSNTVSETIVAGSSLLLEIGDDLLMETGDRILLE